MSFALRRGETEVHLRRLCAALLAVAALLFVLVVPRPALSQTGEEFPSQPAPDSYDDFWLFDINSSGAKPPVWIEKYNAGMNVVTYKITFDTTRYQTGMWPGFVDWYFEFHDAKATVLTQDVTKLVGSAYELSGGLGRPIPIRLAYAGDPSVPNNPFLSNINENYPLTANGRAEYYFTVENKYWDLTHGGNVLFRFEGQWYQHGNQFVLNPATNTMDLEKINKHPFSKSFAPSYWVSGAVPGYPGGYSYTYDVHWFNKWRIWAGWGQGSMQFTLLDWLMDASGGGPVNPPTIPGGGNGSGGGGRTIIQ